MSNPLRIAVSEERGDVPVTILHLTGDLDSKTYTDLESKADEALTKGSSRILLDLAGVTFMGSAGLRAMHSISKKLKSGGVGATLKLASPSDAVSRVLKTLGFDQVFDVYGTLDEALKSY
jgi:anti-sigma B factor antagonist